MHQTPPAAIELYEPSGMPPSGHLPHILDTVHFIKTVFSPTAGQRLDLTQPGPWQLTGYSLRDGEEVTTVHEGPLDHAARQLLHVAYPSVLAWQAEPCRIDETYRNNGRAAFRICQLLGVPPLTAQAILTIAADDILGFKFTYGKWEITGNDDDQTFRIRALDGK